MRFNRIAAALSLGALVAFTTPALALHNNAAKAPVAVEFLVRAHAECPSVFPLDVSKFHNGFISLPTCTPQSASTTGPSFGPNGLCETVLVVLPNALPPKNSKDVKVVGVCKDLHDNDDGSGGLATAYSGVLTAAAVLRITDHYSTGSNLDRTVPDAPFAVSLKCGTAASPKLGKGVCVTKTTANTEHPGALDTNGGHHANVEIQQVHIDKAGTPVFTSGLFLK